MDSTEVYDLLILVDATYSMSSYLISLQTSLPQIISISTLTNCFSRIGLLAYRDYCDKELLEWSGWLSPSTMSDEHIMKQAKHLNPMGGGDGPEATKTGLARAYELMREDATTVILLYTDAPPHTYANGDVNDRNSCLGPELKALKNATAYGGFGPKFGDWVSAAQTLSGKMGDIENKKRAHVFGILDVGSWQRNGFETAGYYNYLATLTGGACLYLAESNPNVISKVTIEVLLAWMGAEKAGVSTNVELPAFLTRYISVENITRLKDEKDSAARPFFFVGRSILGKRYRKSARSIPHPIHFEESSDTDYETVENGENITKVKLTSDVLKKYLPKKSTPVQDFAKRYASDKGYKAIAVSQMKQIIEDDVVAISLNPVFGSLWRAVCNDRENEARDGLITAFGVQVDRISNADEKARMKIWLEESYDYLTEVLETIDSVPKEQRFPCVCLDPTEIFKRDVGDDEDDAEDKPITTFRRDELLEIGRSCDYRILRRLGRVLTRLTYINSADEIPAHIAAAPELETPRIPMALANKENKRRFWKILLHIVVPGTMLSARPAALLAALAIKLGVQPLLEAADQEMLLWRERWNDIEIPETWNLNCLSLLLDADKMYQTRRENQESNHATLLKSEDRQLFELLASYKMLELNLDTTLTARIGWTPEKTKVAIGPTVICRSCEYPRSVTIMGASGECGHCLWTEYASEEQRQASIYSHVTKDDNENTPAAWVECNVRTCRAHYVVYKVEDLRVRAKCHYCRFGGKAPTVECSECLNRIIWPEAYRPTHMSDLKDYKCHMCTSGRKTVVDVETTANELTKENSISWLLRNNDQKLAEPFNKRTLFHTVSSSGIADFTKKVEIFPSSSGQYKLELNGKLIRNTPALIKELQSWVSRRRTESGTCSLCCSSKRKSELMLACGRSGCHQRICKECLDGWYGLNAPGRIINCAALSCPFCRRAPTAKTLAKYGMGIHAVGNLRNALMERGAWIYAWCQQCGDAKQYMERVCAAGAPPDLRNWTCDPCTEIRAEVAGKPVLKSRECPGCGTITEKLYGCNHITCTVAGCGSHWCYSCGGKFDQDAIYGHMEEAHGGLYGDEDDDGGEDDEEYDEE